VAASHLFAEHAAPGLIDLFTGRAADLDVELSVHPVGQFPALLSARAADVAIGPAAISLAEGLEQQPFLIYEVLAVARPDHPLAGRTLSTEQIRRQSWHLGPSAMGTDGIVPDLLRRLGIPETNQRIYQSDAAALEQTQRSEGAGLALRFAVSRDLAAGRLVPLEGPGLRAQGRWAALTLPRASRTPPAAELLRFITTPRATQAMVRGAGVHVGRFKPAVHVTLWS
jgi:DNA-binding transcriptional LysR family regulator